MSYHVFIIKHLSYHAYSPLSNIFTCVNCIVWSQMIAPSGIERGNSDGGVVTHGPWGGTGGILFDDGIHSGVREIHLTRYGGVTSIRVCYDQMGQAIWGIKNGSSGRISKDKV